MEQIKKPEDRFKKLKEFANTSAKRIALTLGIFAAASGPLFSETDSKEANLGNKDKDEILTQDAFNPDSLKLDKKSWCGLSGLYKKDLIGKKGVEVYGKISPKDELAKDFNMYKTMPFVIIVKNNEMIVRAEEAYPGLFDENGRGLALNYTKDGQAFVIEINKNDELIQREFVIGNKSEIRHFFKLCGNLGQVVDVEEIIDLLKKKYEKKEDVYMPPKEVFKDNSPQKEKIEQKEQMVNLVVKRNTYRFDGFGNNLYRLETKTIKDEYGKPLIYKVPFSEINKWVGGEYIINPKTGEYEAFLSFPTPPRETDSSHRAKTAKMKNMGPHPETYTFSIQ